MRTALLPGGTGPKSGGGVAREGLEWILKPNTKYSLTNISGNTINIGIINSFYEV
jgi:hypothetical protein